MTKILKLEILFLNCFEHFLISWNAESIVIQSADVTTPVATSCDVLTMLEDAQQVGATRAEVTEQT